MKDAARPEDKEGSGPSTLVWVKKNKTRLQDETTYVVGEAIEGSRQIRDVMPEDFQLLRNFAHTSAARESDAFFNPAEHGAGFNRLEAVADAPTPAAPAAASGDAKKSRIGMGTAPGAYNEMMRKQTKGIADSCRRLWGRRRR